MLNCLGHPYSRSDVQKEREDVHGIYQTDRQTVILNTTAVKRLNMVPLIYPHHEEDVDEAVSIILTP